jgi:hypothetical protein
VNEDPNVKLIRELKAEIVKLRSMLMESSKNGIIHLERRLSDQALPLTDKPTCEHDTHDDKDSDILKKIDLNQSKIEKLTNKWKCKWQNFHSIFDVR